MKSKAKVVVVGGGVVGVSALYHLAKKGWSDVVLIERKEELISIFFVLITLLIVSSSLMYFVEHEVQPDVFPNIPATMWWGIITLTTVGYGDTYPVTAAGQSVAAVIAILGIGMFALPAGILGAAFTEALANMRTENKKNGPDPLCPHCGKNIHQQQ